jgi:hypothetical protein
MPVLSELIPIFFEGQASAPSEVVPAAYPVAIAGHPYFIEPREYARDFIPVQRDPQDPTDEPGEQTLNPAGLWRRSQSDWSLGAGQEWLDESESSRRRFHESLGIDVFTEREACLLPTVEEKRSSANSNLKILRVGTRFYVVDGATLIFSDGTSSEQNATWVTGWTTATGLPGGNILDITASGSHVYVLASDNSIYRATVGTTSFAGVWFNPAGVMTRLWAGLGRLFASDGRSFYEITATPGETLILTHPDPNMVWSAFCAAPTGVYLGGNIGENGEVRHTWVKEDGTAFVVPVVAAEFENEQVHALTSVGSTILFGTSIGFRFAEIDGQNTGLPFGPVVSDVGSVRDFSIDVVDAETFVWFTWTNIEAGVSGLGRIRPSRFSEPRVPAYASDIYSSAGGTVMAVASLRDRRYFAVASDGFYGATTVRHASGTISTGRIRYGMLDTKVFTDLKWHTSSLPAGAEVFATITFNTGQTVITESQFATASTLAGAFNLGPVSAEWAEIEFTLERATDTTSCPELRAWVLRAIPAPQTVRRFLVPLRLQHKQASPRSGIVREVNGEIELEFLAALVGSQVVVKYQEGHLSYDVHVVNYQVQGQDWNDTTHMLETLCLVELHSIA